MGWVGDSPLRAGHRDSSPSFELRQQRTKLILELADDQSTASGDVQRSKIGVESRKMAIGST